MNQQKRRLPVLGWVPCLLAIALFSTSCISARWVTPMPPLVVADFDRCDRFNNLGGEMGPAYTPPDSLTISYVEEAGRGCVARLDYAISGWSAFWLRLPGGADLKPYKWLVFDARGEAASGIPGKVKLELKRTDGAEISILSVSGVGSDWKTLRVDLAGFGPTGTNPPIASLAGVEELVFTFEAGQSGEKGVVYLDAIRFET